MQDITMTYPLPGTLQITQSRIGALWRFLKLLIAFAGCCSLAAWLLLRARRPIGAFGPLDLQAYLVIYLVYLAAGLAPFLWLAELIRQARVIIWGHAFVFCCDTGTIERRDRLVARFEHVAHIEMTTSLARQVTDCDLSIVLKDGKRLRICCSAPGKETTDVAEGLAAILSVPVVLTIRPGFLGMSL